MKIFIAAPISGFKSETTYRQFRMSVLAFIEMLNKKHTVISEIMDISNSAEYDTPAESAKKDFYTIEISDIFLLIHPARMQTSSLIELGYAYALNKTIIIVSELSDLPFLALGLGAERSNFTLIEGSIESNLIKEQVINWIDSLNVL